MKKLLFFILGIAVLSAILLSASAMARKQPGKAIYMDTCVVCHGSGGEGALPGIVDLKNSLSKSDKVLLDHIEYGYQSPDSSLSMPPKGGNPDLTRAQLKSVLDYIRKNFSN